MRKKYLFFDIDGTLVNGGYGSEFIPASTLLALQKVREAGHFTAIATGRAHVMAKSFMEPLGMDNMVSDGGYGLTIGGKLLGIIPLDKEKVCELIDECIEKDFPWGLSIDNESCRYTADERFIEVTADSYLKTVIRKDLDPHKCDRIYKAYIACLPGEEQKLEKLKELPWCRFHREYIFVEPADKAYGIRKVMDHFNGDYRDVIVFGDNDNDLSMFTDDFYKVAMGNATERLKKAADYVTADINDDGIYKACEYLGLFEKVNEAEKM